MERATAFLWFLMSRNHKIAIACSICMLAIRFRNKTPLNFWFWGGSAFWPELLGANGSEIWWILCFESYFLPYFLNENPWISQKGASSGNWNFSQFLLIPQEWPVLNISVGFCGGFEKLTFFWPKSCLYFKIHWIFKKSIKI